MVTSEIMPLVKVQEEKKTEENLFENFQVRKYFIFEQSVRTVI